MSESHATRRIVLALLSSLSLALSSCESKTDDQSLPAQESTFPVSILAHSEGQLAVPGAELYFKGQLVGTTDVSGKARIALRGVEGDTVALSVKCPAAYYSPERGARIALRHLDHGLAARFEVECLARVHQVVVGLRAENGPHLPILRLKNVVGQTDEAGVAHVLLEAAPNEQLALTLDTSGNKHLQPQNPTLDISTGNSDELLLVSQKFTIKQAPPVRATPRAIPRHL